MASDDEAIAVAERVQTVMGDPLTVEDVKVRVTASIGICVATGTETVEELLRRADTAMYSAKHQGRAAHVLFSRAVPKLAARGASLEADLRRGLDAGELSVVYQPVYDVLVNEVVGVEALVRWDHPKLGVLLPGGLPRRRRGVRADAGSLPRTAVHAAGAGGARAACRRRGRGLTRALLGHRLKQRKE